MLWSRRFYSISRTELVNTKPSNVNQVINKKLPDSCVSIFILKEKSIFSGYVAYHPRTLPSITTGIPIPSKFKTKSTKTLSETDKQKVSQLRISDPSYFTISVLAKLFKVSPQEISRTQILGGRVEEAKSEQQRILSIPAYKRKKDFDSTRGSVDRRVEKVKYLLKLDHLKKMNE